MLMEIPPRPDIALHKGYKRLGQANTSIVVARNQMIAHISAFFWFVRSFDVLSPRSIDMNEPPANADISRIEDYAWVPTWFSIVARDHPEMQGWLSAVRTYWVGASGTRIPGMFFDLRQASTAMPSLSWLYEHQIPIWYPWGDFEQHLADNDPKVARFRPPRSLVLESLRYRDEVLKNQTASTIEPTNNTWIEIGTPTESVAPGIFSVASHSVPPARNARHPDHSHSRATPSLQLGAGSHRLSDSFPDNEHESGDSFFPDVPSEFPPLPSDTMLHESMIDHAIVPKSLDETHPTLSSVVSRHSHSGFDTSALQSSMKFFHPHRRLAARPYGQDMINFFHQRAVHNAVVADQETVAMKQKRLALDKLNPAVRVYEWAEYLVPEGNFVVLSKFERIYNTDSSRIDGVQELIYDPDLMHTFDSFHNELHFVSAEDTFSPLPVLKNRQYHPEFADDEDETSREDWTGVPTGRRDVINKEGALHIAYYRLTFHGRSSDTGCEVSDDMWSLVLDKLQCDSPKLYEVQPGLARGLWQFLDDFDNALDDAVRIETSRTANTSYSSMYDPIPSFASSDPTGVAHSLVYFYRVDEIDDIRQAGLRHHTADGDVFNVESKTARSYMWRGKHSNLVIVGSSDVNCTHSSGTPIPGQATHWSDKWQLVVTAGIDALHACRLISEGESIVDVAVELCNRGIPFKTMVWTGYSESDYPAKAKPIRLDGHQWNGWDYHEYLRERAELLRIPWIRRACYMSGGILWRIAVDIAGPPSRSVFENGPSEAARRGQHACNIRGWVDDELPEDVVALLVGLYLCPQCMCSL